MDKERIENLIKEREQYKFIIDVLSNKDLKESERQLFLLENKDAIQEFQRISKEISDIKWDSLTSLEQQNYLDKYSDE